MNGTLHLRTSLRPSAPTLMFLHAIGTSSWMWAPMFARLEAFSCIAPDLPGHGESRAVPWLSIEDTADRIAELIRVHANGGKAHVVGLSMGSYVGLTLLARHPTLVERAMLSGLNVMPLPGKAMMGAMSRLMAPLLKTRFGARMNANALKIPETDFEGYRTSLRQVSLRSFITASDDASNYAPPANLGEVKVPTLLIAGEREHILIHQSLLKLVGQMPNAIAATVRGLGHGWSAEDPDLFAATVAAWCQAQALPAAVALSPIGQEQP